MAEAAPATEAVELDGLARRHGERVALADVSLRLGTGRTLVVLGPNGAGKSTLLRVLATLLRPHAGTARVLGRALPAEGWAVRGRIGLLGHEPLLYRELSARENLRFFARLYGLSGAQARARVEEVLAVIGLEERAGDQTREYSGGMQRRLNIGIGLLHRPRLLVLDEPTVGVDPQSRNAILESVDALGREGMAVLYTTHYMEEAERLCDRIGILDAGELKAEGTRRELISLVGEHDRVRLAGGGDLHAAAAALAAAAGVERAEVADDAIELVVADARQLLPELLRRATESGARLDAVEVREPNLETVFLHLTGRALRD